MSISDTSAEKGSTVDVPIRIQDVTDLNITSVEIKLTFNSSILEATAATLNETIASYWDEPIFVSSEGTLYLKFSGSPPLVNSGDLVFISFDVIGKVDDTTSVNISHVKFNNGNPTGISNGGLFTVLTVYVDVSLPDTSGTSGNTISIPVMVEDISRLDVLSINMMISYDPQILDAFTVRTEGTLTESWESPTFNDFTNRAHIIIKGSEPLHGSGILIYIDFNTRPSFDLSRKIIHPSNINSSLLNSLLGEFRAAC